MMSGIILTPIYKLGQRVYYNSPDSPSGIVLDIKYHFYSKITNYLIGLGYGEAFWCGENELTDQKIY